MVTSLWSHFFGPPCRCGPWLLRTECLVRHVCVSGTQVNRVETAEPIEMPFGNFGNQTRVRARGTMHYMGYWRHLVNTIERAACCGDAAFAKLLWPLLMKFKSELTINVGYRPIDVLIMRWLRYFDLLSISATNWRMEFEHKSILSPPEALPLACWLSAQLQEFFATARRPSQMLST